MASALRATRAASIARSCDRVASSLGPTSSLGLSRQILQRPARPAVASRLANSTRQLSQTIHRSKENRVEDTPPTDFGELDVLGNAPIPSTSIDVCTSSGFFLNSGAKTHDGSGLLLIGGDAFLWRPWLTTSGAQSPRLLNAKGQFDAPGASLSLLSLVWPRPDLLILGIGPSNRPISPALRNAIAEMGIRVEVLDTRNAAAQFNLLATERGVDEIAAALIPIGWVEGSGAGREDGKILTHQ